MANWRTTWTRERPSTARASTAAALCIVSILCGERRTQSEAADVAGGTARICEGFTDSKSALAHLNGKAIDQLLPTLLESSEITNVGVYGTPSKALAEALSNFPVSGPYTPMHGFTR